MSDIWPIERIATKAPDRSDRSTDAAAYEAMTWAVWVNRAVSSSVCRRASTQPARAAVIRQVVNSDDRTSPKSFRRIEPVNN